MLSYTDMAKSRSTSFLGCNCTPMMGLSGPADIEPVTVSQKRVIAWLASLTPGIRAAFEQKMQAILDALPPSAIDQVLPSAGLGLMAADFGSLVSGILQTGADLYGARLTNSTNTRIANGANATQVAIAQANAAMSGQSTTAMTDMQIQANAAAAAARVKNTSTMRPVYLAAVGGVLVLGLAAIFVRRKKRT